MEATQRPVKRRFLNVSLSVEVITEEEEEDSADEETAEAATNSGKKNGHGPKKGK